MSTRRRRPGTGAEEHQKVAKARGPNGLPLCFWCQKEVLPPKRSFCGVTCVHEWRLRTDPTYARSCVFTRDRGVCARCGVDTGKQLRHLRALKGQKSPMLEQQLERAGVTTKMLEHRTSLWDLDHVMPVAEGGGETGLDNMQTLCIACHKAKTAEQRERAKLARKGSSDGE